VGYSSGMSEGPLGEVLAGGCEILGVGAGDEDLPIRRTRIITREQCRPAGTRL
jgi:hypothetical protein